MDFFEVIKARRSIRKYKDKPVEAEKLITVLEAGRLAPSARNMQDWRFVVVQDAAMREKLVPAANNQIFVGQAPVVIACCTEQGDYTMRCGQPAGTIDVAIAIDHMTLAAEELGLGTCWIGSFYPDQVRSVLKIPESIQIVELLTLGYPDEMPEPKPRLKLNQICYYDTWGTIEK